MSGNKSSQDVQLTVAPDYPDVWLTKNEEYLEWLDGQIESSANDVAEMRIELQKLSERLDKREAQNAILTKIGQILRGQIYDIRELLKERQKNREGARA
jgi:hypothetical protein